MTPFRPETSRGDLIGGAFRKSRTQDGVLRRPSPADRSDVIGEFPWRAASVEEAIDAARRAALGWARLGHERRQGALRAIQSELRRRAEELRRALSRELGIPSWEAATELDACLAKIELLLDQAPRVLGERHITEASGRLRYKPFGVAAVLAPATFPLYLALSHALPLLLAGNAVVLKPSELSPWCGQLLAEALLAAALPRGVVNVIQGGAESGAALAAHPGVDAVFFTGARAHGDAIRRATFEQPEKLLSLHLGGGGCALVDADASLPHAVRECAYSAFVSAGQRCNATARVILHKKIAPAFLESFSQRARSIRVGYPFEPDVFCGPMRSFEAREQHLGALASAARDGAERLFGGEPVERSRDGAYLRPSAHVVADLPRAFSYFYGERFAPDVAFVIADDLDEAISLANQGRYGLALSYFGRREKSFEEVFHQGRAGLIHWNRGTAASSLTLPFGGLKQSGNHRAAGAFSLRHSASPIASLEGDPSAQRTVPLPGFGD